MDMIERGLAGPGADSFHLERLERFARLITTTDPHAQPERAHLARFATLSSYRDCVGLGLVREANVALARAVRERQHAPH